MKRDIYQKALDKLIETVTEYLSECDNPAPDYIYRRDCRERMRKALDAVKAPEPQETK